MSTYKTSLEALFAEMYEKKVVDVYQYIREYLLSTPAGAVIYGNCQEFHRFMPTLQREYGNYCESRGIEQWYAVTDDTVFCFEKPKSLRPLEALFQRYPDEDFKRFSKIVCKPVPKELQIDSSDDHRDPRD